MKSEEEIRDEVKCLFEQYYQTDSENIVRAHEIVEQRLWVMHWILDGVLKDIPVPEHLIIAEDTLTDMKMIQKSKREHVRQLTDDLRHYAESQ
jgi:hypothetical protein